MGHFKVSEILSLFVTNLGRNAQPQRRSMFAGEGLAVHLVAEQGLGMRGRRHIQRLVIVVRAFDGNKTRSRICANNLQKVREADTAEMANYVPSFHTDVPSVLRDFAQSLNLRQPVVSWFLHSSVHSQRPLVEIDSWVIHVVAV